MKGKTLRRLFAWLLSVMLLAACIPSSFAEEILSADEAAQGEANEEGTTQTESGTACEHKASPDPLTEWEATGEYMKTPETHAAVKAAFAVTVCEDCGEKLGRERTGEETAADAEAHSFGADGVCTVCGYNKQPAGEDEPNESDKPSEGTPCEHKASDIPKTDWVPVGEYMKTPETHAVAKAAFKVTVCELCGEELKREPMGGEMEPAPEAHTFVDGVCTVCGYALPAEDDEDGKSEESNETSESNGTNEPAGKTPCEHKAFDIPKTDWVPVGEYVTTPETHAVAKAAFKVTVCELCGEELKREPMGGEMEPTPEAHTFVDGVCTVCGYALPVAACEHRAAAAPLTEWKPVGEYVTTPETHAIAKAAFKVTVCELCGEELNREPMGGESEPQPEAHTFENGVCAVCGYAQPTEEEKDEPAEETECLHESVSSKTIWVTTRGYKIGQDTHAAITAEYKVTVCEDCGEELSRERTGKQGEADAEAHDFGVDCICTVCGYEKPIPPAKTGDDEDAEFSPMGSDQPAKTGDDEDAVFIPMGNGQPAADEPMTLSGESCTHEVGLTKTQVPVPQGDAVSNGNGSHTQTYKDHYTRSCSECDMHEEWDGEPYTQVQPCSYGPDGRCFSCNYLFVCTHEMTKTETYPDPNATREYESNGDGTHTCTYRQLSVERCVRCEWTVSEPREAPDKTETIACSSFDENGVCRGCGYQKPVQSACDHPDPTKRTYEWIPSSPDKDTFTPNADGMTHTVTGTFVKAQRCLICNRYIEGGEDEQRTYSKVVTHNFNDDGMCYQCGYKRDACAHLNAYDRVKENWGGTSVVARDANGHTVEGWIYTARYCPDCGKELGEARMTGEKKTSVADHSFDENGQCRVCGYVSGCAHERTYTDYALVKESFSKNTSHSERKGATQVDALYHKAFYDRACYVICLDCGTQVSKEIVETDVGTLELHEFEQGKCTVCGYEVACEHLHTDIERLLVGEYQITAKDENTHTAKYQVEETTRCADCGELLSVKREPAQEASVEHLWRLRGGYQVCADCGYQKADDTANCAHAHVYTTEDGVAEDFNAVTAQADGHLVTYSKAMQYTWCEDCDAYLGQKIIGTNKTVLEPHVFANGKCVTCGYVNTCKHNAGTAVGKDYRLTRNVKDNGDGTHTMLADVWTYTYCKQCNEDLSVEIARNQTVRAAHNMQYGECIYCFAKAQQKPSTPPQSSGGSSSGGSSSGGSTGGGRTGGTTAAAVVPVLPVEPVVTPPPAEMTVSEGLIVSVVNITSQLMTNPSATIEIVGAEDVMTQEEYQRFDRLSLSEQIMVMLSVAGATEDITSVLPPSATLLTTVAQTLITEITGRIETSGETPFQFEISDVAVNGAQYKCVTITFEITTDGVKTLTTRSFYFDPMLGEWVAMDEPAAA